MPAASDAPSESAAGEAGETTRAMKADCDDDGEDRRDRYRDLVVQRCARVPATNGDSLPLIEVDDERTDDVPERKTDRRR